MFFPFPPFCIFLWYWDRFWKQLFSFFGDFHYHPLSLSPSSWSRGRRPLHKIRVCLSFDTSFYKQILPKYYAILNFPNSIQKNKQMMCFPVHTIQVYRRPAWCFLVFLGLFAALGVCWIVLFTR
jgi:hypothetical protein